MALQELPFILFVFLLVLTPLVSPENAFINGTKGAPVLWPCQHNLSNPFQPAESRIYWQGLPNTVVHVYNKGQEEFKNQKETFANRTKVFPDQLASGNFSLLFEQLKLEDDGTSLEVVYVTGRTTKLCQGTLYVAVPFQKPQIEINRTTMTANCSAQGGYPKPQIKWTLWDVSRGLERTLEPEEAETNVIHEANGTYSINSIANVTGAHNVTCSVHNPTSNTDVSATQTVPAEDPKRLLPGIIAAIVIVIVVLGVVAGLTVYARRRCANIINTPNVHYQAARANE